MIHRLVKARRALDSSLNHSKTIFAALSRATPCITEIHNRLPSLEVAVRPIHADLTTLSSTIAHIDRIVGPAVAVLKVFDTVHGFKLPLLSDPALTSSPTSPSSNTSKKPSVYLEVDFRGNSKDLEVDKMFNKLKPVIYSH